MPIIANDTPPQTSESDQVLFTHSKVALIQSVENTNDIGTLTITSTSVSWFNEETSKGIQIDFPSIVMHAVANTEDYESLKAIGTKMIYCQLDSTVANDNNDDDEELPQELRLIPIEDDKELHERSISAIYDALCKGAELNPDPESDDEGGAGQGLGQGFSLADWEAKFSDTPAMNGGGVTLIDMPTDNERFEDVNNNNTDDNNNDDDQMQ
mmetsp:Transcript_15635/g.26885  ORF Transcript_15635/g.26885 Transcript_15635/m.26885 type:complete len:211 (+) Transcript_15635:53-685(+)